MTEATTTDNVIPRTDIVKRSARLGAEIKNIRLSGDLSDQTIAAINMLLLENKVVFFRDQGHLDDAEQELLLSDWESWFRIRQSAPSRVRRPSSSSILSEAGGRADQWHTDVTFVDAYPKISVLRGVVIPPFGGDTVWSNTAAAYLDLPSPLQRLADELWAVHSNAYDYAVKSRASEADKKHFDEVFTGTVYETEHPVVRVHPETGERTLVLGNFVQRFVGLPKYDSQKLFDLFQSYVTSPENTVRWRWKAGDVAIWDNRATQHYAVNDYGDQHRIVRRATIDGDVPVSVDGRRSVTRIKATKPQAAKAA